MPQNQEPISQGVLQGASRCAQPRVLRVVGGRESSFSILLQLPQHLEPVGVDHRQNCGRGGLGEQDVAVPALCRTRNSFPPSYCTAT